MKAGCWDCVLKHLGNAKVQHPETRLGYPEHSLDIIGHLDQASEESLEFSPQLAEVLRQHRKRFTQDTMHVPPYDDLYSYVRMLEKCHTGGIPLPEPPVEVKVIEEEVATDDGREETIIP